MSDVHSAQYGAQFGHDPGVEVNDLRALTERAARQWPEKVGLIIDASGEALTFAEIDRRSNAIGNALRNLGVRTGDRVAVMLGNVVEFPLTWLAIAKIGAAMVPINIHAREADGRHLIENSGATLAVTAAEFLPLLARIRSSSTSLQTVLSIDEATDDSVLKLSALVAGAGTESPNVAAQADTLVGIQYTSGTTGRPKGCMLTHSTWLGIARFATIYHPWLNHQDVLLTAQPFYYIDPQWNLAVALAVGAPLVVLDRFHSLTFMQKVREYGVTFFYCLGGMPTLLHKTPATAEDRLHRLRLVVCSGIPAQLHRTIEERWGVPWYEAYGLTETGGANIVVPPEEHDELVGSGSIGRPVPLYEIRLVDQNGRSVQTGETGEILVRGPGFMQGYWRDPEATRAVLQDDGWFHTGDLARMDEKGRYYFLGRSKDVIKRSGENISAAEVEEVLSLHEAVRMAACVPVKDEIRGEEVKAYVVLHADIRSVTPQELADFCAQRLAYFKVPRYWELRNDLPRTPSEKLAKWALVQEKPDLTTGSYDRVEGVWR